MAALVLKVQQFSYKASRVIGLRHGHKVDCVRNMYTFSMIIIVPHILQNILALCHCIIENPVLPILHQTGVTVQEDEPSCHGVELLRLRTVGMSALTSA